MIVGVRIREWSSQREEYKHECVCVYHHMYSMLHTNGTNDGDANMSMSMSNHELTCLSVSV